MIYMSFMMTWAYVLVETVGPNRGKFCTGRAIFPGQTLKFSETSRSRTYSTSYSRYVGSAKTVYIRTITRSWCGLRRLTNEGYLDVGDLTPTNNQVFPSL